MLQITAIGHIGGDAEVKTSNGREFTTFRIAHTDRWTDDAGQVHENTQWVDCIMNGRPGVLEYLKKGQMVYVNGGASLRVYSSAKDRCMKAGITINVKLIELLGGRGDDVPNRLYDMNTGAQVEVKRFYNVPSLVREENQPEYLQLVSRSQEKFICDRNGWVTKDIVKTDETE